MLPRETFKDNKLTERNCKINNLMSDISYQTKKINIKFEKRLYFIQNKNKF